MASPSQLIYSDDPGAVPATYQIPPGLDLRLVSVLARWNAAAASGTLKACLSVYSQDGKLMGRFFPEQTLAVGDSAVVTYAPFYEVAA